MKDPIGTQYRHGDLLIERVASIPDGAEPKPERQRILAYGEATGHCHTLETGELFEQDGQLFFRSAKKTAVTHQEHGAWDAIWLENCAIVSRRPKVVRKDDQGRLHCTTGPAVEWADGWTNNVIHGVRLPDDFFMQPLTVKRVLGEQNVEVRRTMVEMMGRERFVAEAEATVVDTDHDLTGMPRRLLRIAMGDDEPLVLCEVQCPSTGHHHYLRVPPQMERCSQAIAWTFSFEAPEAYRPKVEA